PSRDAILRNVLEYLGYDTAIIYDTSERGAEQGAEQPAEPEPEEGQDAPVVQGGEGSPAGQVSQYDRERAEVLLEQGNVGELAPYLTDEEITEFLRLWDAFEPYNEALGEAYTRLDADLKSTDKKVKKAAQEEIGRYEAEQEVAFEPVNAFTQTLIEKYGLEEETGYQEPEETDEEEGFEEYDKEDELEEPKQKKGKKAPKKEKEKPFIVVGGASEATIAKQTYTQEELEEFHYTQTYFDRFESKKTKELIQIYGYYHGGTVPDGNNIIHIMRRLPDEEGNYSKDGIFTGPWQAANVELDYLLKYFKANKFKHVGKKEGHKNKYGFWVNPSNVIVNAIEIELPSTHKGWANLNSVEFAQNDEGNWVIGESFHTGTGGYSSGAWNKDKGYEKKSDAIRKLIQDAEEFLNSNFKEDKSKSYEQRDIENLIRTLKTKTLPQALLEEGAVDNFTRVEFTAADYDEGFQGDLFPDEEATAEPAPEGKKPKRKTTAKKAATKKAKPAQKDNVASEEEEEAEPRFTLEDEEGTPGDYHWIEERICTNPTFITLPGDDRLDAVPKVVLAEKDGNWYYNTYLTDDSGKGSSWGSLIPTFKGNYVPYQTREDAVKHAISY
ncbi:MAG: hypothetical protein J6W86_07680, partial [Bacteroidales bacterium]|nr:hypothetical protein [Bacteroidales bacterium]